MSPPVLVMGLGDPVMDILASVTPNFVASVTAEPGGSFAVCPAEMAELMARASAHGELRRCATMALRLRMST